MKILLVAEFFPQSSDCEIRGGAESRTFFLAKYLVKAGHKVFVLASAEIGLPKEDEILGAKIIRTGIAREYAQAGEIFGRLSFLFQAVKAVEHLDFDLVDGQNFLGYLAAAQIAKKKKIPSIATYHDVWIGEWIKNVGLTSGILGEVAERFALGKSWNLFIAISDVVEKKLVKVGINPKKIVVIPVGIDWEEIQSLAVSKSSQPEIVCISRLVEYKRVGDLILALKNVKSKIPQIKLKIIGTGPERKNLEDLVKRLELQNNIEFLGFVEKHTDVLEKIASAKIFCLPSAVEGFGIVILEAVALGVPFVAAKIPAIYEVTKGGNGGLLYPVGNINELSINIIKLLTDETLYSQKSIQAKNLAKNYDWGKITQKIVDVYQKIL